MRNRLASAIGAAGIGLVMAACSSSPGRSATSANATSAGATSASVTSSSVTSSSAAASSAAHPSSHAASARVGMAATVSLASFSGIPAKALKGSNGRALYLFEADKNGTSACTGACAAAWPPDTVTGMPHAGPGVNQAMLGTIERPDGTRQVTYHGHPLYYFIRDSGAGTAHGQGSKAFGAGWYVVSATGAKIDTS
jgi:predicted lipoprotein with Yx(FWY)xxD motif